MNTVYKYNALLENLIRDLEDGFIDVIDNVYIIRTNYEIDGFHPIEKYFFQKNHAKEHIGGSYEKISVEVLMIELKSQLLIMDCPKNF